MNKKDISKLALMGISAGVLAACGGGADSDSEEAHAGAEEMAHKTGGMVEVPSLAFVYFDPRTARIERAETQPLMLEVRGGVATSARVTARGARAPAMRASLDPPERFLYGISAPQVAVALALALALHGALWLAPQLGELRHRRAGRVAPRRNVICAKFPVGLA